MQTKFVQDMVYGLVKSKSVLLSNISDALIEPIKKDYEKGYMVTEMVAVTQDKKQPISLFSHIHSSTDMQYRAQQIL